MEKERILFVVHYSGTFGYIKPWTAVRDGETYSQQFLTPSIVEGMEKKLFPETLSDKGIHKIARHIRPGKRKVQSCRTKSTELTIRNNKTKSTKEGRKIHATSFFTSYRGYYRYD